MSGNTALVTHALGETPMNRYLIIGMVLFSVVGCAAPPQVVQINPGIYSLSVGALGIEGGEAGARNKALAAASNYCAGHKQQLSVQTIDGAGPVEWGSAAGSATVIFQCVD
jgi:hypothetical protein